MRLEWIDPIKAPAVYVYVSPRVDNTLGSEFARRMKDQWDELYLNSMSK